MSEFAVRWTDEYVKQQRNKKGRDLADARLESYILPELGRLLLQDVQPEHLRGLRGRLESKELSPLTVKHVLSDARCLLRYAARKEPQLKGR